MMSRDRSITVLRASLVAAGAAVATLGLFMDRLGLGQPGGLGIGQSILLVFGLFGILAGVLGNRFFGFYKSTATIVLNTLLLLAFLELVAMAVSRSGLIQPPHEARRAAYLALPYYASQDWSWTYWQEAYHAEAYRYEPYLIWRHAPFQGEVINVGERGLRETPGSECGSDTYTVFMFGGSSMWGWGAPAWGTIPANLRRGLSARLGQPVCVVNYGEDAYVSTQEVLALILELQRTNVPDAVVFYDGVNDVYSAYQNRRAETHLNAAEIAATLQGGERPALLSPASLRLVALMRSMADPHDPLAPPTPSSDLPADTLDAERLAALVAERYLSNIEIVQALAGVFGFDAFFFWQPHLALEGKAFAESERAIRSLMPPSLVQFTKQVYQRVSNAAADHSRLWYIADALDTVTTQVWIDAWGHITPHGNEQIATRILQVLEEDLGDVR